MCLGVLPLSEASLITPGPQEALLVQEGLWVTVLFLFGMAGPPWQFGDYRGSVSPPPHREIVTRGDEVTAGGSTSLQHWPVVLSDIRGYSDPAR